MKRQNRNRLIDTENKVVVAIGEVDLELGEKDEEIEKCRLLVIK